MNYQNRLMVQHLKQSLEVEKQKLTNDTATRSMQAQRRIERIRAQLDKLAGEEQ